jgi:hypothetical protein
VLMRRFGQHDRGVKFDVAPESQSAQILEGETLRGGSADGVHFRRVDIELLPTDFEGLFEFVLCRFEGGGRS